MFRPRSLQFACVTLLLGSACGEDKGAATDVVEDVAGVPCQSVDDCAGVFEILQCELVACTVDGVCAIAFQPPGTPCRDGFACTGPDFCVGGQCGGAALACDDDDPCTADSCDHKSGCEFIPTSDVGCDDGNPCTEADTCVDGACLAGTQIEGCCRFDGECDDEDPCTDGRCVGNRCTQRLNFAPCNDDNPCTTRDHCDGAGGCGGDELVCSDGNPCTLDICNVATGVCESAPADQNTTCEDGNPCTVGDTCSDGVCVGAGSTCQCTTDADCASFEDGDLCNGTLNCLSLRCVVDPLTVVECNPTGDTTCVKNTCDQDTGQCVPTALGDGAGCEDQNPCTEQDVCLNGLCSGRSVSCDDDNPCTFDACSPATGCTFTPHTQPCNDQNPCTANDKCGGGVCAGTTIACDDQNACTTDTCEVGAGGCVYKPNTRPCDDGNPCTEDDVCADSACSPGVNSCECITAADCAPQEDGNACNGTLTCDNNRCVVAPGSIVTCGTASDSDCRVTSCEPSTGNCVQRDRDDGTVCDDGSACTSDDKCAVGVCVGVGVDCDDDNPCTTDGCETLSGCTNVNNTAACNDSNACTGPDRCAGGQCNGVTIVCDDGNACTVDSCNRATGCAAVPSQDGIVCSDQNACTTNDRCDGGTCKGQPANCDDTNPCTVDSCGNPGGCRNVAAQDNTPCNDGTACTSGDRCTDGVCGGTTLSCDDGDACTVDSCDSTSGCVHGDAEDGEACTDGDPCTSPDRCQDGACQGGGYVCGCQKIEDCASQEDGDLCNGTLFCDTDGQCKVDPATVVTCTTDEACARPVCVPETGACSSAPVSDGEDCDDLDGCTVSDTCQGGTCTGISRTCDDANPCTFDGCEANVCTYSPAFDGQLCADDGEDCTQDRCLDGVCEHPAVADGVPCLPDTNSCTDDVCISGSCAHPALPSTFPCQDDGNICTFDSCGLDGAGQPTCLHVSNDPPDVTANECKVVREIVADSGRVTGAWDECGVADHFRYDCQGAGCGDLCNPATDTDCTGAMNTWNCADPDFLYEGPRTGYEYAYVFVAPIDGVCTFIEYNEGAKVQGQLQGLIDWFLLDGSGTCEASACLHYVWENVEGGICGGNKKTCSFVEFAVEEQQVFYIVADVFAGLRTDAGAPYRFDFDDDWTVEIICSDAAQLLLNEDFADAECDGCSVQITGASECDNFGWHPLGGFSPSNQGEPIGTSYYLGDVVNDSLAGYDCGASQATLTFPTVTLPVDVTSCAVTFDLYTAVEDTDCTNDVFSVWGDDGPGAAFQLPGDACGSGGPAENPVGGSSHPNTRAMRYDISAYIGSSFTLSFEWVADDASNSPFNNTSFGGVIIDDVKIACE